MNNVAGRMRAIQSGFPSHLSAKLDAYGRSRCESMLCMAAHAENKAAFARCVEVDGDLCVLGRALAAHVQKMESFLDVTIHPFNPETYHLPFTRCSAALPFCAKALRATGVPEDLDFADMLEIKSFMANQRDMDAVNLGRLAAERSPDTAYFYWAASLTGDSLVGLRMGKKGLKCKKITPCIRLCLIIRAIEHETALGIRYIAKANSSDSAWELGAAFLMSALEDAKIYMDEAPPDNRHMSTVISWYIILKIIFLDVDPELNADLSPVKDALAQLKSTDELLKFLGLDSFKTTARMVQEAVVKLYAPALDEWREAMLKAFKDPDTVDKPLPEETEESIASWLARSSLEDEAHHATIRRAGQDRLPNIPGLYKCSWCNTPSAGLRRCGGCEKTRAQNEFHQDTLNAVVNQTSSGLVASRSSGHRFDSSYGAHGLEAHDTQRSLAQLEHAIDALEDELTIAAACIEQSRARVRLLGSSRGSKPSPIQYLPVELLSEIFLRCPSNTLDVSRTPWTLIQVCKEWSAVALDTPQLWASISLRRDGLRRVRSVGAVNRLVEVHLNRAKQNLLDLTLDLDALSGVNEHHPALDILMAHSSRWRSLSVVICIHSFRELASVKGRLPTLRYLDVKFRGYYQDIKPFIDFFETAPALREVSSMNMLGNILIPFSGIKYLHGGAVSPSQLYHALRHAHNIIHLAFDSSGFSNIINSASPSQEILSLPHLTTLETDDGYPITNFLNTPCLRDLTFIARRSAEFDQCTSLLSRSSCSLECLDIASYLMSSADVLTALKCIPTLRQLTLRWMPWLSPVFFNQLAQRSSGCWLTLPSLKSLRIDVEDFDGVSLMHFVESRTCDNLNEKLKAVIIDSNRLVPDEDVYASLSALFLRQVGEKGDLYVSVS
ncbi:hypothetical protein HGRIS_000248 [Hohenbuehelia grisea]|uniref:F-box domain-containing protein n=1 Tax=Hohenbuehelia grisea TaxID=104357 RepID=A0ABR3JQG9_9AGAR